MKRLSQINLIWLLMGYLGLIRNNVWFMSIALIFGIAFLIYAKKVEHYALVFITFGLALTFMVIISESAALSMTYKGMDLFIVLSCLNIALYIEKITYLRNLRNIFSSYFMMIIFSLVALLFAILLFKAGVDHHILYRLVLMSLLLIGPYIFSISLVFLFREYQRRS